MKIMKLKFKKLKSLFLVFLAQFVEICDTIDEKF